MGAAQRGTGRACTLRAFGEARPFTVGGKETCLTFTLSGDIFLMLHYKNIFLLT